MRSKTFKSLDEQINILRDKGLVINDEDYAKEVLLRENYFFLNGYRHLFMKSKDKSRYIEGTKFEEVYSLFLFDRRLRNILFKNILSHFSLCLKFFVCPIYIILSFLLSLI